MWFEVVYVYVLVVLYVMLWRFRFFFVVKYFVDLENWYSYYELNENMDFFKVMDVRFCFYGVLFLRLNKDIWKFI